MVVRRPPRATAGFRQDPIEFRSPEFAAFAIEDRLPFSQSLTPKERMAIAITSARPTNLLHIHSLLDRPSFMHRWRRWVRRMERARRKRPLIYVATVAKSRRSNGGHHAHVLLWEYLHLPVLKQHCREVRFGREPQIRQLPPNDLMEVFLPVTYVLGQHEPVFGTTHHYRHEPLPKGARAILLPQRSTLRAKNTKLLDALTSAEDPSVSDFDLVQACPVFSNKKRKSSNP